MLARILEPEVMDTAEEARDYDAMDHSAVNAQFATDFLHIWDTETPILDVCTGPAHIPIEVCRQCRTLDPLLWDSMQIVAVDLAEHMLARARRNVEHAGFADRIAIQKADAKALPFPDADFGAVICNGSVHHIPDPFACFAEMHRVCSPNGIVFVRDLIRPASESELRRLVDRHAVDANDHQREMFTASFRAALTLDEVRALVGRLGYAPERVQQTSDRHWTFCAAAGRNTAAHDEPTAKVGCRRHHGGRRATSIRVAEGRESPGGEGGA